MIHPDSDTLLQFILGTLAESDRSSVAEHLARCEKCSQIRQELLAEVQRLENIDIHVDTPAPPAFPRRSRRTLAASRWAAVLAAGFLLGYLTARIETPLPYVPVQQHLVPASGAGDSLGFMSCQAVDAGIAAGRGH